METSYKFQRSFITTIMRDGGWWRDGAMRQKDIQIKNTNHYFFLEKRHHKAGDGFKSGKSILKEMLTLTDTNTPTIWWQSSKPAWEYLQGEEENGKGHVWNWMMLFDHITTHDAIWRYYHSCQLIKFLSSINSIDVSINIIKWTLPIKTVGKLAILT